MAKILIIEDDEILAQMYSTRLNSEGYVVITERDGGKGVALAVQEKPDVVLLDLMLPGLTGHQVLSELRKNETFKQTPIIVLSNLANPQEEQEAMSRGATKYLVKTKVTPSEVLNTITQVSSAKT